MSKEANFTTTTSIRSRKNGSPIVAITAYDALFAKLFDDYADIILVGDSLNMSFNAQKDTLNLSMQAMIYHTKAVRMGVKRALLVADMPFGSYTDEKTALKNALKLIQISGADAVKLEGGENIANIIKALNAQGIAVMGHIGLRPQQVRLEGGYKIKGRDEKATSKLIKEAQILEEAGVFATVLEGTVSSAAKQVCASVKTPIIGIGAGADTDGQILVWSDLLGFTEGFKPKFAKRYLDGANLVREAVAKYADEVKERKFPNQEFEYQG